MTVTRGYTQQEVSDETGIEQSSVSRILKNTQKSVGYQKGIALDAFVNREKEKNAISNSLSGFTFEISNEVCMAEKLLANASSKLTLEEKAKMEWIAKLEGKNSLSNLIRSMCKKKISEVEGEMAGKSSLEVIKNICTRKVSEAESEYQFLRNVFCGSKDNGYTRDTFELVPLRAEKSRHTNASDKSVQLDLLSWK